MSQFFVGVDPGARGGVGVVSAAGKLVLASRLPATDEGVLRLFRGLPCKSEVALEKVGGYVGGDYARGSHMFTFGACYGALRMALAACEVSWCSVSAQRWQRGLGVPPKRKHTGFRSRKLVKGKHAGEVVRERCGGETDAQWKRRLRDFARGLFPAATVTLAVADALLIAEWLRRSRAPGP